VKTPLLQCSVSKCRRLQELLSEFGAEEGAAAVAVAVAAAGGEGPRATV
jgi:hypothetical protein